MTKRGRLMYQNEGDYKSDREMLRKTNEKMRYI